MILNPQPISNSRAVEHQVQEILIQRQPLARLRRRELYAFAKHFNVAYTPGEPAETLRQRLLQAGFTGQEPIPNSGPAPMEVENPEQPVTIDSGKYDGLKWTQLRKLCKERGLEHEPKAKSVELKRLLNAQDASERGQ